MSHNVTFFVMPVRDGKLAPSDHQKGRIAAFLKRYEGGDVRVALSTPSKTRSNNQNAYMWGVVYSMIADETGHTTEEVHEYMKAKFLPREYVMIGKETQQVTKSTAQLSTDMMEAYLEQVRAFAATELGLHIPLPHEA